MSEPVERVPVPTINAASYRKSAITCTLLMAASVIENGGLEVVAGMGSGFETVPKPAARTETKLIRGPITRIAIHVGSTDYLGLLILASQRLARMFRIVGI